VQHRRDALPCALAQAERCPGVAAVLGRQERIVIKRQHYQGAFRMIAVQRHIRNVLVLEAVVRRSERRTAVRADLDAFALRSNDNFLRVLLVNDQCVDDPVARGHTFEILVIHGLPETAGRPRVQNACIRGSIGSTAYGGTPKECPDISPTAAAIHAVIDPRTRRGMHAFHIRGIDDDAHHIGVIDHALHHRKPVFAAIRGLPRQVISSSIDDVGILRSKATESKFRRSE